MRLAEEVHSTHPRAKIKKQRGKVNRIKEKLKGFHNGNLMGIEGHVNVLINEAIDPENLALLFLVGVHGIESPQNVFILYFEIYIYIYIFR